MNIDNWNFLYKLDLNNFPCVSQHIYEPLINPQRNVLCLNYTQKNRYCEKNLSQETVDYFFKNELYYLQRFSNYTWCPKILDVYSKERKIFLEWNDDFCNHNVTKENVQKNVNDLKKIIIDLKKERCGKISIHSHCCYYNYGNLKTIDFFSCFPLDQPLIEKEIVNEIMSDGSRQIFQKRPFLENSQYNLLEIYKFLLKHDTWASIPLNICYEDI